MSGGAYRCGHPRSQENNIKHGAVVQCRACHDERIAERVQRRQERDREILSMFLEGKSVTFIGARFSISRERVQRILNDQGINTVRPFADDPNFPERSLKLAAHLAGANVKQLVSEWRAPKILVHARWAVMMAWRERDASTTQIGRRLNRDHSTVCYGLRQAKYFAERYPAFRHLLDQVRSA